MGFLTAAGASRRLGRLKLVDPAPGAPIFHSPLRALLDSGGDVGVGIAPDAPEPPLPDGSDRVSFARDEVAYEGPLAGTRIGLERVRGEHAVLLAADMPGVSARLLSLMADRAATGHRKAVVLRDVDGPRPLPAVLMVAPALARARALLESGERRLRALIEDLDADGLTEAVWRQEDPNGTWRRDVDLPEDLPKRAR